MPQFSRNYRRLSLSVNVNQLSDKAKDQKNGDHYPVQLPVRAGQFLQTMHSNLVKVLKPEVSRRLITHSKTTVSYGLSYPLLFPDYSFLPIPAR